MKSYTLDVLDNTPSALSAAVELLYSNCPNESERYEKDRLIAELCPQETLPFYRKFFGAYDADGRLIAVSGVKAADWASNTHILYMMAVEKDHRGQGIGSDLEMTRIQWLRDRFHHGRCLVSTRHKKRFERWKFKSVSEIDDRHLMILEF